jgi:hypothetical protein
MLLYLPDELSVDEAKAIAVRVLAIAYEQEEAKLLEASHHRSTARR